MINATWVKIYRKITKWEWYQDSKTVHLFLHLILKANHADKKWQGIMIERGQIITGRIKLSQELGMSEQSVRTSLKRLKSTNEITIKTTSKHSIITVCNYDTYNNKDSVVNQQGNQQVNQQVTSNQPASNQQVTTNKNTKELKELKNDKKKREEKRFTPPTLQEIKSYVIENNFSVDADKFYKYFDEGNWIDSKGNKVRSWKQKLITWESKNNGQTGNGKRKVVGETEASPGKYDGIGEFVTL